jgi:glutathione S-transferase
MSLIYFILALSLLQYVWFALKVGRGRELYGVKAPAISGHPQFERLYRVQMNTLEQLVLFVPSLVLSAHLLQAEGFETYFIACLGVLYLVGRGFYSVSYEKDPTKRGLGFMVGFVPTLIMLLIAALLAAREML